MKLKQNPEIKPQNSGFVLKLDIEGTLIQNKLQFLL